MFGLAGQIEQNKKIPKHALHELHELSRITGMHFHIRMPRPVESIRTTISHNLRNLRKFFCLHLSVSPFALFPDTGKSVFISVNLWLKSLCSVRSFAANSGFGCASAALCKLVKFASRVFKDSQFPV
jgi:hypothetical protein